MSWTVENMMPMNGKLVVITGANSGIGFEAAKSLASKEYHVILAVRDIEKGSKAVKSILKAYPEAKVEMMLLDVADLTSVHRFATEFNERFTKLDILINNAGVMNTPYRKTVDGFELQLGTNHLGHFALTGLLLPTLLKTEKSRVVNVSSAAHKVGKIQFDNLDGAKGYSGWRFYGQSKLANLLFTYELQRKLANYQTMSVACHPGFAATNLQHAGSNIDRSSIPIHNRMGNYFWGNIAQSAEMGSLPTLYAATESLSGGEFIGPTGKFRMYGYPNIVKSNEESYREDIAKQLWEVSENLTGVKIIL